MSWKLARLADICEIKLGKTPSRSDKSYWDDEKLGSNVWVSIADLTKLNSRFIADSKEYITDKGASLFKPVKAGTLLMSFKLSIGKVAYANCDLYTNEAIVALPIKDRNQINSDFLFYFLKFYDWDKETENDVKLKGKTLNKAKLNEIKVPLPPLPTQEKIVAKLDELFIEIDRATVAAEANAKNAEVLFQSFLKETFNNSKKQSTKIKIENIANITSSKRIMKHEYVNEGIPFYRTKEVKELANKRVITTELFISKENYYEIKRRFGAPRKGEILITAIGTIGEIYVIDTDDEFYFKDGNVLWAKDLKEVEPEFLKYVLMSFVNELNELSLGAAYSALPIHKLKNYEVLIPNLEYQRIQIISIKNMEGYSNKLTMEYIKKKSLYSSLKQSILKQAFNGELLKE